MNGEMTISSNTNYNFKNDVVVKHTKYTRKYPKTDGYENKVIWVFYHDNYI